MKKILCILVTFLMLFFFLLSPGEALAASRRGLALWFDQLLPALLPFTVLSYVILQSNLFSCAPSSRNKRCGIRPQEWYVIVCGFLFGFPIGSKLTADLYRQGRLSSARAQWLFIFSNNLSPVFTVTVLSDLLGLSPGICTCALLYGLPLCTVLAALFLLPDSAPGHKETASRFRLNMQIIDAGIINGFETLIKICGYVVLFSLCAQLIDRFSPADPLLKTLLIGCTEVTTGMSQLSALEDPGMKYVLAVGFLSWGGISGFFQTASIVSGTDLSMKRYLAARLLLAALASVLAFLFCRIGIR